MECLDLGFESSITVLCFPESVRRMIRTSNYIERINRELKRRSTAIGVFPNGESIIRLMGTLLIEYHEKSQAKKRMFFNTQYMEILSQSEHLKKIAKEQEQFLVA